MVLPIEEATFDLNKNFKQQASKVVSTPQLFSLGGAVISAFYGTIHVRRYMPSSTYSISRNKH